MLKMIEDTFTLFEVKEKEKDSIIHYLKGLVNMTVYIIVAIVFYIIMLIPLALTIGIPISIFYYISELI